MIVGLIVYIPTQIFIELASLILENQVSLNDNLEQMRLANNIITASETGILIQKKIINK